MSNQDTTSDHWKLCQATTRAGRPCKNYAVGGTDYCRIHQPASLQVETPQLKEGILERLRGSIASDFLDLDTWKGIWYMLNNYLEYQSDILKRRLTGDYETDEWGLDREYLNMVRPFFEFLYKNYWRVQTTGIENVPGVGRALLVSNHSGQLPWDGAMVATAIMLEQPEQRLVRSLYGSWAQTLPVVSEMLVKCGQVLATEENGTRLLEQDELIAVYPEGYKGIGKLFKDRYHLARFGRGGFIKMALKTHAPIIPVSVVGAEEIYVSLAKSSVIAKFLGTPFFPISPVFPWFGPLGFIPLPTKWYIDFGESIKLDSSDEDAANNLVLVAKYTDQIRNIIQEMIYYRLSQRRSVLFG